MVDQTQQGPTYRSARGAAAPVVAAPPAAEAAATAPRLLLLILVCLLTPGVFRLAGAQLSPYRVVLLAAFPFLVLRWLRGEGGRPCAADVLVLASALWTGLALYANHGASVLPRAVILLVEVFGGYLVGRMLIRNATDYRLLFRYMFILFLIISPFAVVEMLTGFNGLRAIFDLVFNIPARQGNLGYRLGFVRAQGPLEHPILFGLVGSMSVANVLYIYRDNVVKAWGQAAFFVFMVFTSVSSGPLLSVLVQMILTVWDRVFAFLKIRWIVFVYVALFSLLLLRIASQFHLLDFVIQNLMFNPEHGEGRLIILEYGTAQTLANPFFGIGLDDWERPWWKGDSFDNYWLGQAMRFGIPTLVFFVLAIAVNFFRIALLPNLTEREADYRRGYLITLAGLTVTLGTVNIWTATNVLVSLYVGAGVWFFLRDGVPADEREARARLRRSAQARAIENGAAPAE